MKFDYYLYNPSGNITALVSGFVPAELHVRIANEIMKKESSCEQVGFLASSDDSDISVLMTGGEFCGNAVLCAAAFYASSHYAVTGVDNSFIVRCSGCDEPLKVKIVPYTGEMCIGVVEMPKPAAIEEFSTYKLVRFAGISHLIVDDGNDVSGNIKEWTDIIGTDALGIMFYDPSGSSLKPLVYVKNSDTLFWENSCASGSSAIAYAEGEGTLLYLNEPGGVIKVENKSGTVFMTNKASLIRKDSIYYNEFKN